MNPLAALKDIQGLDPISIWPLAVGWWILIGIIFIGMALIAVAYFLGARRRRQWEYRLLKRLEQMEATLSPDQSHTMAIELAGLMRRLALYRYSRQECAQLQGKDWLKWMSEKDPKRFDWTKTSGALAEAPFQPPGTVIDLESFRNTIRAAKGWIK